MCGRFTTTINLEEIERYFKITRTEGEYTPLYNAAPSQDIPVIQGNNHRTLAFYRWGLIPSWAKDKSIGNKLINARAETLLERPSFRSPYLHKRCLIPADSFFEWKKEGKRKIPHRFLMKDNTPFAMAALWDVWITPDKQPLHTCSIITTDANNVVQDIHDRMPIILDTKDYDLWLDPSIKDPAYLNQLLKPFPGELMYSCPADLSKLF